MKSSKSNVPQKDWTNSAVGFNLLRTVHFHKKIGYENSSTDKGNLIQVSYYIVSPLHKETHRKVFVAVLDIVEQQYEQDIFPTCVVVSSILGTIAYLKRVHHHEIPATCIEACMSGYHGERTKFVDKDNHLILPKNIVSVALHHLDELWSTSPG